MLIKSNFFDYYDCMMKHDDDRETILLRKACKPEFIEYNDPIKDHSYSCNRTFWFVIGFAGKLYPAIWWQKPGKYTSYSNNNPIADITIYDKEAALDVTKGSYHKFIGDFFDYYAKGVVADNLTSNYGPIFIMYQKHHPLGFNDGDGHCPYDKIIVRKNICLQDLSFQKVLHPAIAYNELKLWLNNQARPAKPIPEMSNDIKIHQAGFDRKTSFRKGKK